MTKLAGELGLDPAALAAACKAGGCVNDEQCGAKRKEKRNGTCSQCQESYGAAILAWAASMAGEPCAECPFRRTSAAGYLGAASGKPREFLGPHWDGDVRLPCHMSVDWEAQDSQEQAAAAPLCKGFLIMARNASKAPTDPEVYKAVRQTDPDREKIFTFPHQFYQHHGGDDGA